MLKLAWCEHLTYPIKGESKCTNRNIESYKIECSADDHFLEKKRIVLVGFTILLLLTTNTEEYTGKKL